MVSRFGQVYRICPGERQTRRQRDRQTDRQTDRQAGGGRDRRRQIFGERAGKGEGHSTQ